MPPTTHRLRVRQLNTVGFVDKGDDPKAEIVFFKRHEDDLHKRIVERGGKFILMDQAGTKILGTHNTRAEAERQLAAVDSNNGAADMEKGKLGSMIQRAREAKDMTQGELASRIGVTAGTVGAIESGEIMTPPRVRLRRIASALDISLSSLESAAGDEDALDRPPPINAGKRLYGLLKSLVGLQEEDIDKLLADGAASSDDDDGANTGGDMPFDIDKLDEEARVEFEKLQGQLAEATGKIAEFEKTDDDVIDKSELPEAVAKAIEDFEKRTAAAEKRAEAAEAGVEKLEDEREVRKYIAKAKSLGLVPDDHAVMIRKIAGVLDDEEFGVFEQVIKSLVSQAKEGGLYKEIGSGGMGEEGSAESEVSELVKAHREKNPDDNEQLARGMVMKNRPDLRRRLEAEQNARASLNRED